LFNSAEVFREAELGSKEVVSIPVHPSLSKEEVKRVAEVVNSYEG
jgi:dTDP-4-amino-4,6-dideoxygalactose transaminase